MIEKIWLGGLDSNQDSQIQSLESYQLDDLPADQETVAGTAQGEAPGYHRNLSRVKAPSFRVNSTRTFSTRQMLASHRKGCRTLRPMLICPRALQPPVEACRVRTAEVRRGRSGA